MRTSTNCLIMNLAICDLLNTVFQTPISIAFLYIGNTWFGGTTGKVTCGIIHYGSSLLLSCSIFNLVAIAVDRFLAVTRPLTYKLSSKWLVKRGIPVIWLCSALLSIGVLFSSKGKLFGENRGLNCLSNTDTSKYATLVCILCSFIALTVLYSVVCYRLWKRNIPGEVSSNQNALAIRTARKVTVLMISVVIVFFVSWAPVFILMLLELINASYISVFIQYTFLLLFIYWLVLNSSACNPCLYFIFIESFRRGLQATFPRCRPPEISLHRFGRFETKDPPINRQPLNIFAQEERDIQLTAYSLSSR